MAKNLRGLAEVTPLDLSMRKRNDTNCLFPAIKDNKFKKKQKIKYNVTRNHLPINPDYLELLDAEFEKYPLKIKNEIKRLAARFKLPRKVVANRFSDWRHQVKKSENDRLTSSIGQYKCTANNIQKDGNNVPCGASRVNITGSRNPMSDPKVQTVLYLENLEEFGFQIQVEQNMSLTDIDKDDTLIPKDFFNHSVISECTISKKKRTRFEDDENLPNHSVIAENINSEKEMTSFGKYEKTKNLLNKSFKKLVSEYKEKNQSHYMIDESLMTRANIRIKFKRIE